MRMNHHTITLQDENNSYNCLVNNDEFIKIQKGDYEVATKVLQQEIERKNRLLAFKFLKESTKDQEKSSCSKKLFIKKSTDLQLGIQPINDDQGSQECRIGDDEMEHSYVESFSEDSNLHSANGTQINVDSENNNLSVTPSTKMWTDTNIRVLIELYKQHENQFENSIKKIVWKKVAQKLSNHTGINITWSQCDTKFKGLKEYYKTIKKHNDTSGNNFKFWIYYDLMDEILGKKPEIVAAFTCSNLRGLINANKQPVNEITITKATDSDTDRSERASEPSASSAFESLNVKKRKKEENAVERRHKDKMRRQDKYLDLFERLVTCLEEKKD